MNAGSVCAYDVVDEVFAKLMDKKAFPFVEIPEVGHVSSNCFILPSVVRRMYGRTYYQRAFGLDAGSSFARPAEKPSCSAE